jgi:single-strand DNA-binding protein
MGGVARSSVRPPRLARQEVTAMSTSETATEQVNEVTLVGRMSQPAEQQVLPSGSELVKFRVIVGRPPSPTSRVTVDALDCVVWTKRPARAVAGWRTGDLVEVKGSLRRRFFAPTGGGRVSRCEVEVASAKLIRRADG